jgi:hypothetical protein
MTTNTTTHTVSEIVLALRTVDGAYEAYDKMAARERANVGGNKLNDNTPVKRKLEAFDTQGLRLHVDMGELAEIAREQMEDGE